MFLFSCFDSLNPTTDIYSQEMRNNFVPGPYPPDRWSLVLGGASAALFVCVWFVFVVSPLSCVQPVAAAVMSVFSSYWSLRTFILCRFFPALLSWSNQHGPASPSILLFPFVSPHTHTHTLLTSVGVCEAERSVECFGERSVAVMTGFTFSCKLKLIVYYKFKPAGGKGHLQ